MALTPDGGVDREPVLHEVWNIQTLSKGRARPPGLSYASSQCDLPMRIPDAATSDSAVFGTPKGLSCSHRLQD
jgi:hypothetical protein